MRHNCDSNFFPGVFAPVLSLDALCAPRDDEGGSNPFDITDPEPLADAFISRMQAMEVVNAFVATLTAREREIVRLIFWEDRTQTEVAAIFTVSKMAICKAVARIREKGRFSLSPELESALV